MLIRGALVAIVLLVGLGLLALGVVAAVAAVRNLVREGRTLLDWWGSRTWPTTRGTVTRALMTMGRFRRGKFYGARIAYAYTVAGQHCSSRRYRFESASRVLGSDEAAADVGRFAKGTDVAVYFNPQNPQSATLDRQHPGVALPLFLTALLALGSAGAMAAGVYVMLGPFTDPPPLPDDELPPLHAQVGGLLVFASFVALCLAGLSARRGRRHRDLVQRLADVPDTRIADVRRGKDAAVFGRVEAAGDDLLAAPGTGEPAVYYRARVLVSGEARIEDVGHGRFYVNDGSGRILVSTRGSTDRLPAVRLPENAAVLDWVDASCEDSPPAPYEFLAELLCITPGSSVLVVGRVGRGPDGDGWAMFAAQETRHSLVIAAEPLPDFLRQLTRPARRARVLTTWAVVALLVAIALLVA